MLKDKKPPIESKKYRDNFKKVHYNKVSRLRCSFFRSILVLQVINLDNIAAQK